MTSLSTVDLEFSLKDGLDRHLTKSDGVTPAHLAESIRYSLLAPGKRIRPRLLLACGSMLGLKDAAVFPPALAIEMIHCFTLIHDDLPCMDDDDFRRGRPSNHKKFGESTALLAGDGLIPLAYEVFLEASAHVAPENLVRALNRFSWAMGPRGVVGGQAAEGLLNEKSKLEDLITMHGQKTGALFMASLLIPKDLAGIADDSSQGLAIEVFARELGFAFQVVDDLDDATEEKPEPSSILHYLSPENARSSTLRRLDAATNTLNSAWGNAASGVNQIAFEVMKKLETDQNGTK